MQDDDDLLAAVQHASWPAVARPQIRTFVAVQQRWCAAERADLAKLLAGLSTPNRSQLRQERVSAEVAVTTALGG